MKDIQWLVEGLQAYYDGPCHGAMLYNLLRYLLPDHNIPWTDFIIRVMSILPNHESRLTDSCFEDQSASQKTLRAPVKRCDRTDKIHV